MPSQSPRIVSTLTLFAVVVFGLAVRGTSVGASLGVVIATICLGIALQLDRGRPPEDHRDYGENLDLRLALIVVLFGVLGGTGFVSSAVGPTIPILERLPGWLFAVLGVATYLIPMRRWRRWSMVVASTAIALTLVVGALHVASADGIGFDVLFLHAEAADALSTGLNPYTDVVEVADGSPHAEPGEMISGYVYPPLTAASYALGDWIGSDPRYTSLAAWLGVLALLGLSAVRSGHRVHLLVMLAIAAVPGWPLVLRAAWTEPLSLFLLTLGFCWWVKPIRSGVGLGLGLASKQYFLVTAPVFLLVRGTGWVKRLVIAFGVVGVTVGAFVLWDPVAFWEAAVAFHTSRPPRFDSINVVGLLSAFGIEWAPPSWLALGAGLVAAFYGGRQARSSRQIVIATAFSLAASFLVSSQAFANYWFLLFGLCALALIVNKDPKTAVSSRTP